MKVDKTGPIELDRLPFKTVWK